MNHTMREFAQGLLVEAIDASYAMGFVEIIFRGAYFKPGKSATSFLKTFARKASANLEGRYYDEASTDRIQ
ncbi:MAG: hypothetical protein HY080_08050 [Gammaproteobacteria bacterium]|nr:hypothetical protein [Gammaproteobacteria bacterium]